MRILKYKYQQSDWSVDPIEFGDLNLIVGESGVGKTRILTTMFHLGVFIAQRKIVGAGIWDIVAKADDHVYEWQGTIERVSGRFVVSEEFLRQDAMELLRRTKSQVFYKEQILPKLSSSESAISILQDEPEIKPLYDGFALMLRRRFSEDETSRNSALMSGNKRILDSIGETKSLVELYKSELPLTGRLHVLANFFPQIFSSVVQAFCETFTFVKDISFQSGSDFPYLDVPTDMPIVVFKESNVGKWIRLDELSAGMQKVLLIITDLLSLPPECIYLLDEYENSLGVSAIGALPRVLSTSRTQLQIFITSHHPYIIREVPIKNWYVLHREGTRVQCVYGDKLIARYGHSNQDKYLQLLNDPFYSDGVL